MLQVENLDVFYGDVQALDGVSLEIAEGAIVAIVGANGAGKTTLIRALAGMHRAGARAASCFAARIFPAGRAIASAISVSVRWRKGGRCSRRCRSRKISTWAPCCRGRAPRARSNRDRVLAMFPVLAERAAQAAGTLSGGEQQMLAIGRCLMGAPDLIMFDEPSLGLAPTIVRERARHHSRLSIATVITCLLVEQNVALSLKLASRAYVLENGRVTLVRQRRRTFGRRPGAQRLSRACEELKSRLRANRRRRSIETSKRGNARAERASGNAWRRRL